MRRFRLVLVGNVSRCPSSPEPRYAGRPRPANIQGPPQPPSWVGHWRSRTAYSYNLILGNHPARRFIFKDIPCCRSESFCSIQASTSSAHQADDRSVILIGDGNSPAPMSRYKVVFVSPVLASSGLQRINSDIGPSWNQMVWPRLLRVCRG